MAAKAPPIALGGLLIYLTWILLTLGLHLAGRILPEAFIFTKLPEAFSLVFTLGAALYLTRVYARAVEPAIQNRHLVRMGLLGGCLLVLAAGYFFVALTGMRSPVLSALNTANLVFFALLLGFWMTFPLKRPAEILPLCLVAALADLFSVVAGPTRDIAQGIAEFYTGPMTGMPPVADFFLVKAAFPGQPFLVPVFGISDWVIVVFLSAAAARFHMDDNLIRPGHMGTGLKKGRLFLPASFFGLLLTMTLARITGAFIPALPFVTLVYLGVMGGRYPQLRRLTRAELLPMAVFSIVMLGGMAWLWGRN